MTWLVDCPNCGQFERIQKAEPVLCPQCQEPDIDTAPGECECDNTHRNNDTVCRFCWSRGRRQWDDPEVFPA